MIGVSKDTLIDYSIDAEDSETTSLVVRGEPMPTWRLEFALRSFVEELSSRLEHPLVVRVDYKALNEVPMASLYAVLSLGVIRYIAEEAGYSLSDDEVLKAANSIDDDAGVSLDYVKGLRTALVYGSSMVFREGEEPISISLGVAIEVVGEEELGRVIDEQLGEALLSSVTRLAGLSVVEVVGLLREKTPWRDVFLYGARLDNALYYLLYGVEPPGEECKWTPSLQTVHGICMEGAGLGRKVELV